MGCGGKVMDNGTLSRGRFRQGEKAKAISVEKESLVHYVQEMNASNKSIHSCSIIQRQDHPSMPCPLASWPQSSVSRRAHPFP